jgi:hypothetical protein
MNHALNSFRTFLEREIHNGEVLDSLTASYRKVAQYANSSQHLIALAPRNYQPDLSQNKTIRIRPTKAARLWTPANPTIVVCGLRHFMQHGLNDFHGTDTNDMRTVHLLEIVQGAQVVCGDEQNQSNPWLTINTTWRDIERKAEQLIAAMPEDHPDKPHAVHTFARLRMDVDQAYHGGPLVANQDNAYRLRLLHRLVYMEGPRFLQFLRRGYTTYYRGYTTYSDTDDNNSDRRTRGYDYAPDTRNPRAIRFNRYYGDDFARFRHADGVDIVMKSCPIPDAPWGIVHNPRAVRTLEVFDLPANFRGYEQVRDASGNDTGMYRIPGAPTRTTMALTARLNAALENFNYWLLEIAERIEQLANGGYPWRRTWEQDAEQFDYHAAQVRRWANALQRAGGTTNVVEGIDAIEYILNTINYARDQVAARENDEMDEMNSEDANKYRRLLDRNEQTVRSVLELIVRQEDRA